MVSVWIGKGITQELSERTDTNFTFGKLSLRHLEVLPALDLITGTLMSVINSFLQVWEQVELEELLLVMVY